MLVKIANVVSNGCISVIRMLKLLTNDINVFSRYLVWGIDGE